MKKTQLFAFLAIVALALLGEIRAEEANTRASRAIALVATVDHRGDIRACTQENLIRTTSNSRDAALEQTASLVKDALKVLGQTDRPGSRSNTNHRLKVIARKANKIQINFKPGKITNCEKQFPKPKP